METIVFERLRVATPLPLNPADIVNRYRTLPTCSQARFKTDILVTYHPNVPASTTGQAWLAITARPTTSLHAVSTAQPHATKPVWKKFSLHFPKSRLNLSDWMRPQDQCMWLSSNGLQGNVTISCTIHCVNQPLREELRNPELPLELDTSAVVGPRLAGFSLSYYGSRYPQLSSTGGQVINIDFAHSTGWTTTALYVRTPEDRPYVAVRYGWYSYTYNYNSDNKGVVWNNNGAIIEGYSNPSNSNAGDKPSHWGDWARIKGSTSWWCETKPDRYLPEVGTYTPLYMPFAVLFLYYDFGDVDIFDPSFQPSPAITPSLYQPIPGPVFTPGRNTRLTLNGFIPYLLGSAQWHPTITDQELKQKKQLVTWKVDRYDARKVDRASQCDPQKEV